MHGALLVLTVNTPPAQGRKHLLLLDSLCPLFPSLLCQMSPKLVLPTFATQGVFCLLERSSTYK